MDDRGGLPVQQRLAPSSAGETTLEFRLCDCHDHRTPTGFDRDPDRPHPGTHPRTGLQAAPQPRPVAHHHWRHRRRGQAAGPQPLSAIPGVEQVLPILKPFKLASREMHSGDSVVEVGQGVPGVQPVKIGGGSLLMIAGPCAIESAEILDTIASAGQGRRRQLAARRGVQAAHQSLQLPGTGRGGAAQSFATSAIVTACRSSPR